MADPRERLDDGTIRLRRYTPDDLDQLHPAARESIAEVGRWLPWLDEGYTREDSRGWIEACKTAWEAGDAYEFLIESVADGRFLGGAGLQIERGPDRRANLGYWVRATAMGQGVAPAAVRLLAEFGLRDLELSRLELVIAVGNARSLRVAEKVGAVREGVLRKRLSFQGAPEDAVMYSIVAGDVLRG